MHCQSSESSLLLIDSALYSFFSLSVGLAVCVISDQFQSRFICYSIGGVGKPAWTDLYILIFGAGVGNSPPGEPDIPTHQKNQLVSKNENAVS